MELRLAEAWLRPVYYLKVERVCKADEASVHFPGAVNSKFTTKLSFERPSTYPTLPTYRIIDSEGRVVDKDRAPIEVGGEEVTAWYKNMLTGACP